jgi:hypothetical protein
MTRPTLVTGQLEEGWQGIETLPPKGKVLGYDKRWGVCEIMRSDQMDYWAAAAFNGQLIRALDLRAWQPLPEPPAQPGPSQ